MGRPARGTNFTLEEQERGLLELALQGSSHRAARVLRDRGVMNVSAPTLDKWRRDHSDRYAEITAREQKRIEEYLAAEQEEIIRRTATIEHKMLDKIETALKNDEIPARDLAGALRNISTSKAITQDKVVNPVRGRASGIIEHRGADAIRAELEARMRRLGMLEDDVVDSEAEEIHEDPLGLPSGEERVAS